MLLTPDTPSTASRLIRNDTVFVLVLTLTLVLATSTFFASFTLAAIVAGTLLSILLHHHVMLGDDDSGIPATPERLAGINIAAVRVGGDAGGLIFVVGSLAIVMLGLPSVRWFLLASVAAAAALAATRIAWTRATDNAAHDLDLRGRNPRSTRSRPPHGV